VKGKLTATPVAIVRGFPLQRNVSGDGAHRLVRRSADDMFRLGTREARRSVVADSAPVEAVEAVEAVDAGDAVDAVDAVEAVDEATVQRVAETVAMPGVDLEVTSPPLGSGVLVVLTGDPLATGVAVGRLLTALAAEDLRGYWPVEPPAGATTALRVLRTVVSG
jgi:hypothetical protein